LDYQIDDMIEKHGVEVVPFERIATLEAQVRALKEGQERIEGTQRQIGQNVERRHEENFERLNAIDKTVSSVDRRINGVISERTAMQRVIQGLWLVGAAVIGWAADKFLLGKG
jgi:hypothetical protein